MSKKYKALHIIGTVYKVIGAIVIIVTIFGAAASCISGFLGGALFTGLAGELNRDLTASGSGGMIFAGLIMGFGILLWGLIVGVTTYAAGEGVFLLIDIEENTRLTALLLKKE